MSNLSLKQIEQMSKYLSPKELEKALSKALDGQQQVINTSHSAPLDTTSKKAKELTLDEVLVKGGATTILHNGNKYRISVLTEEQLAVYDNLNSYNTCEDVVELPPLYKYWCKLILGGVFTVKCGSYSIAQDVVDSIFGAGRYSVSASKL